MKTRTRSLVALILVAAGFAACDMARDANQVTGPQESLIDWRWAQPVSSMTVTASEVTTSTVVAVIGTQGGKIQNGDHVLTVPRRAVASDTEFTFTVVGGDYIRVALTAQTVVGGVTVSQFPQKLTLKLSYRNGIVTDPSRLVVAWLIDGTIEGAKQAMPSSVDTNGQFVTGVLTHFSEYGIGAN